MWTPWTARDNCGQPTTLFVPSQFRICFRRAAIVLAQTPPFKNSMLYPRMFIEYVSEYHIWTCDETSLVSKTTTAVQKKRNGSQTEFGGSFQRTILGPCTHLTCAMCRRILVTASPNVNNPCTVRRSSYRFYLLLAIVHSIEYQMNDSACFQKTAFIPTLPMA
jgi:hypothetical protein